MMIPKHLCVDISAHGLGHMAQATAVINSLDFNNYDTRLTIRSMAPRETLRERIRSDISFDIITYQQDNGMAMKDALHVDRAKSMDWYRSFHSNYSRRLSDASRDLESLQPDLVFGNIPYLSLEASSLVGIESVAMCSLNWADIFEAYCGDYPGAGNIHSEILHAYSQASLFLQPTPSMPMSNLAAADTASSGTKLQPISPLAFSGTKVSPEIMSQRCRSNTENKTGDPIMSLSATPSTRFILIAVGGVGIDSFPLDSWPTIENTIWIFPDQTLLTQSAAACFRSDFVPQSQFEKNHNMLYIDLLSSCDLVITKTGYGTQTECALNQIPAICINRHDWPEHPFLRDWHYQNGEVEFLDWSEFGTFKFEHLVHLMLAKKNCWTKDQVIANGDKEAAKIIQDKLFGNDGK